MLLYYFLFPCMNIFLKHAILSKYWDISLPEIKSSFYLLSVLASIMNPNFCVFTKYFFTIFLRLLYLYSVTSYFQLGLKVLSHLRTHAYFNRSSIIYFVKMTTIHRFTPFSIYYMNTNKVTRKFCSKYLRNCQ